MPGSPLGILLIIAAVYLVIKSPLKTQTMIRMAIAFVVTILVFFMDAIVRHGDPRIWGQIGGLVGLLAAVIAGWWHVRSAKPVTP